MKIPLDIHDPATPMFLHGVLEFVGIFVAFRYYLWLKKKQDDSIEKYNRLWVITGAALGAVLGARILGSLENVPAWMASPSRWQYFYGNKTLVGGLLGGLAGVELVKKVIGEHSNNGDLFTFPLMLGMIIGRIGCFLAGIHEETYGLPSSLPWAMDLGDGIYRHPVTLYEILFLLLLWVALLQLKKHFTLQQGALFKLFMIAYLVFRFCLDFIKPGWWFFFGLGSIQLACFAGLLYYAKYIFEPRSLITSKQTHAS